MNDFQSILLELKNRTYSPIYLLMGEEGYFIDQISDKIAAEVLTEEEKEFNYTVMYGREVQADDVVTAARSYPMAAKYNLVIVKEAQSLSKIERLEHYFQKPVLSTILVIEYRHGKVDARKKIYKLAQQTGRLLVSNRLYENKIPDWILAYGQGIGIMISQKAAKLLCDFLGTDLTKIENELSKLVLSLPSEGKREITSALIEEKIGISKDYNNFELVKSLAEKNVFKSNQIVNYFIANPKNNPINVTLSTLFNFYCNLMIYYYLPDKSEQFVAKSLGISPYFVKEYRAASNIYGAAKVLQIVSYIRFCDARTKGVDNVSTTSGELLKELVYKILH